ncbi:hypothetical protein KSF78_0002028 [Schistosoma japonicum]|nr:hypothetical protein KSF78_0002028 [Schistosoma japonicum]KAH8855488.1 hypothetical protein KSF78_0002028 [Schistosoma japonicum]
MIYTHDNSTTELRFYRKLLSINYLIGRRFRTLCQSSGISCRSTLPMTTNISLSTPNCQKDTYLAQSNFMHKVLIEPSYHWPNYTLIRTCSPTEFYYDLNADVHICYGANSEPMMSGLNQRLNDIKPLTKDKSYPPLFWWDKAR